MNVRAARPSDYEAWLAFVSYLQVGGTPSSRERFESGICPHAIFVEDEGQLVGYALSFVFGTRGDVRQIAVAPNARQRGVGRRLMAEVRAKLVAGGCRDWRLEVLAENAAAIALYRSVGMAQLAVTSELVLSNEVRAGLARPVFPVEPVTDDLEIETAFDLGLGQVQRWRSFRPTARLVHIGDRAFTQIIDDFSPEHGLMFPVLAADDAHLASLFSVTTARAYEIVVERTLADGLLSRGATHLRDSYVFGGSL